MISIQSIILCFAFFLCASLLCAQERDYLVLQHDSVPVVPVKKANHIKAMDIVGVAVPVTMITYGILSLESHAIQELDYSTKGELHEDNYIMHNHVDDFMQFSPAILAFGLKLGKVESTHKLSDMIILYALSNALETAAVYTTKTVTTRERPDGSSSNSFPSGHTATAFVAAQFLHEEYKDKSLWVSVSGYTVATLIGASRVYNNRHWVSDVVTGAGIGILSTKIVYWTYPYLQKSFCKKDKKMQTFIFPSYNDGNLSLNFSNMF